MIRSVIWSLCTVLGLASTAHAEKAWSTFRNGPTNNGHAPLAIKAVTSVATPRNVTKFASGGLIWGTAVIDDEGTIYFGSADKRAYAITASGQKIWDYRIFDRADSLIDSAPALTATGKLVIPGGDGFVHAVDAKSGRGLWTFKADGFSDDDHQQGAMVNSFEGNVQVGPNGLIYAGSDNGYMYAIKDDGQKAWSFKTDMMIWSTPGFAPDMSWLAFGSLDGHVYFLNPETGEKIAAYKTGGDVKSSPAVTADGKVYVGSSDQYVYGLRVTDGWFGQKNVAKDWAFKTKGEVYSSPAILGDTLVIGSLDGTVYGLNRLTGEQLWIYETNSPVAASPAITADGVVLFGAKNGKLYALDLATGERIWSYKATDGYLKSNLDASPAVSADGKIYVGSYGGVLYGIPFEYCANNRADERCAFGGHEDRPDFGGPVGDDQATLRFEDREGGLHLNPAAPLGLGQMLRLKLVALEGGDYLQEAAVSPTRLTVKLTPGDVEIEALISSDGKYLDVFPKTFFKADTDYKLEVSGRYFVSTSWIWDRLRMVDRGPFSAEVSFSTRATGLGALPADLVSGGTTQWGVASMYLYQPQALDTYIPAALDGQGFIMTGFGFNQDTEKFLMLASPAYPHGNAGATPMHEPSKTFVMASSSKEGSLKGTGAFRIAAMGGDIRFDRITFAADLSPAGSLNNGEFLAMANCLTIGGSGGSYKFPIGMIHTICDPWMRLIGVGRFEQVVIAPRNLLSVTLASVDEKTPGQLEVTLSNQAGTDGDEHLLSVVRFDHATSEASAFGTISIKGESLGAGSHQFSVPVAAQTATPKASDLIAVFLDQALLTTVTVP